MLMHCVTTCLLLVLWQQPGRPERPAALQALESARLARISGRIDWAVLPRGEEGAALRFVNRYASNGDLIFEVRGDADGWTMHERESRRGVSRFPRLYLINADGFWQAQETGIGCSWWKDTNNARASLDPVRDVRMAGLGPTSWSLEWGVGTAALWGRADDPIVSYETTPTPQHHIVTATRESGAVATYFIAPDKGWNAERITYRSGSSTWEVMCRLERCNDLWLPTRSDYYVDGVLTESIVIHSATIDEAEGPRRFTLADIGVQPGEAVSQQDTPAIPGKPLTWNGETVVGWDDWLADVKAGKREWGPRMQRVNRGEPYDSVYLTDAERGELRLARLEMLRRFSVHRHEGLWTTYVRDFIARYKLDNEQTQKAMLVLSSCQDKANAIIQKRKADFESALNRIDEAKTSGNADAETKAREKLEQLYKPIHDIFSAELCPRLEKLPTREQRKAAEESSATAPTR